MKVAGLLVGLCLSPTRFSGQAETQKPAHVFNKPPFKREAVDDAVKYERELSKRYAVAPPAGNPYFLVLPGASKVLITAPHATKPLREGSPRFADGGTGSLAYELCKLADVTAMIPTYAQPSDPNYYDDNEFKRTLEALLKTGKYTLVLDLHGSHPNQAYDLDFGTMGGRSVLGNSFILDDLASRLARSGILDISQDFFPASANATITKFVVAHHVPCVQLEINATWLISASDGEVASSAGLQTHRFGQLLKALVGFVSDWNSRP